MHDEHHRSLDHSTAERIAGRLGVLAEVDLLAVEDAPDDVGSSSIFSSLQPSSPLRCLTSFRMLSDGLEVTDASNA